jgi:hypothetical protein
MGWRLAMALAEQGRDPEAAEVLRAVETTAEPDDVDPQVGLRTVQAGILARRGAPGDAVNTARQALDIASATEFAQLRGTALLALGHALQARGARDEAVATLREGLELFERKENLTLADRTRTLLTTADQEARA